MIPVRTQNRLDRGSGPVEFAILIVPLLLLTFIAAQAAFVFNARSTALGAATQGSNAARAYNAGPTAGVDRANAFLTQVQGGGLRNANVTMTTTGTEVTVTVTGTAVSIFPGLNFEVWQQSSGPVERWIP
jgi:Flp pilus assembly protein TadG